MTFFKRFMSIILAAACFMLAVTGAYGIYRTNKYYKKDAEYLKTLQTKIDAYDSVDEYLEEHAVEYRAASSGFEVMKQKYETKAEEHREELAIYTATKSGIQDGEKMLASAWGPVADAKKQLKQADKEFQKMYDEFMSGKEQLITAISLITVAIKGCDTAIAGIDATLAQYNSGSTPTPEQLRAQLQELTNSISDEDREFYKSALAYLESKIQQEKDAGTAEETIQAMIAELLPNYNVSSLEELREKVNGILTNESAQQELIEQITNQENILDSLNRQRAQLAAERADYQAQYDELYATYNLLVENESALMAGKTQLDSAKAALAQGEAALASASKQIRDTKEEMNETGASLSDEIFELVEQKNEIDRRQAIVDDYEAQEEKLESCRYRLLNYEEIEDLTDSGTPVDEAAKRFHAERSQEADSVRINGICSGIFSIAAFLASVIGVLGAFGKLRSGVFRFLPFFTCFILSLTAQKLRFSGGISSIMWSALIVAVLSAFLMLLNLFSSPKKS